MAEVSPIRAYAERAADRARKAATNIRSIAGYADPALEAIASRSGMGAGTFTPDMAGNVPYQSELLASGMENQATGLQSYAAQMPRLINAYRAYQAEEARKAKGSGGVGSNIVAPTTPEVPDLSGYLTYQTPPSDSRMAQEFTNPYQYSLPTLVPPKMRTAKKPEMSAAYMRMLESRSK